jgi:hypothetical protein
MNTQLTSLKTTDDRYGVFSGVRAPNGSRMPIDVRAHWDWRNPLNVLPLGVIAIVIAALLALVLG